ncbi:pentatricopeptide repeat-containing protein [Forsythia ovata]|uniref:Pentatricopeptide repeat-containing protein n=1 Tax=Forsythia ovata TaxID=205694 RepID=A0ABD1WIF0_9LAMI
MSYICWRYYHLLNLYLVPLDIHYIEHKENGKKCSSVDEIRITLEENHIFYMKAIKKDPQMDHFKYDIIFMMDAPSLETNDQQNRMDEGSDVGFIADAPNSSTSCPLSSTVKRMLFESPSQSTPNKRPIEEYVTNFSACSSKDKDKILEAKRLLLFSQPDGGANFKRASIIFDEMLSNGVPPDRITYNSLLTVCSGAGSWETARSLFSEMVYRGIDQDIYARFWMPLVMVGTLMWLLR